ncbi:MAG: DUF4190 domain-containing protein [Thermoguttaceae bacterium]
MSTSSRFPKTEPIISGRLLRQLRRAAPGQAGYRSLNGMAIACLVLGLLSAATFVDWALALLPVASLVAGWIALQQIRRNPEETAGLKLVRYGAGLAVGFWILGSVALWYRSSHRAPPGYTPIKYSQLQPAPDDIEQKVPEEAIRLDRQKVYIEGYMVAGRQRVGLTEFVLTEDPGDCAFCKPMPRLTQMIKVKMNPPRRVDFTPRAVGVAGKLIVIEDPKDPRREELGGLVYEIEADLVR